MKKTRFELSIKEQEIMELFWNSEDGLTSVDIYEQLRDSVLNSTDVHRALNTLIEIGRASCRERVASPV